MTKKDSNTKQESQFELTDKQLEELANFKAAIDNETMYKLEEAATSQARGLQRRLVLAAMARSADELSKLSLDEPDIYDEMLELSEVFLTHAKALAEFAEKAIFRMKIADARELSA